MITWSIPTSRIQIGRNCDNGMRRSRSHQTKRKTNKSARNLCNNTRDDQWWGQDTDVRREIFVYIIQFPIRGQYSAVIAFRAPTVSDNRSGRRFLAGGFTVYANRTSYTRQKQFTRMNIIIL